MGVDGRVSSGSPCECRYQMVPSLSWWRCDAVRHERCGNKVDRSAPRAHLYVLPWIQLREPITFGGVEVAPAQVCLDSSDVREPAAQRILSSYKGLGGAPLAPGLMRMTGSGPLDLNESDIDTVLLHRMCLSAGLIMSNSYYNNAGYVATNDAHCEGFFHRFTSDAEHVSILKRRREGQNLDGWPLAMISISEPLSASAKHLLTVDESLLDALVTTISGGSELGQRLERALPPFLQGNKLSEQTTILDDLVWMGAAFERLFDVTTPVGENLAEAVADRLVGFAEGLSTWTHTSRSGIAHPEAGPWRQRWMREFYDRRSIVHSGHGSPGTWSDTFHGVIAAEVFALAVKQMLDQDGSRHLTDLDKVSMDALDGRIEALTINPGDPVAAWMKPHEEARVRLLRNAVTDCDS